MSDELDRDPSRQPSIAEMTAVALSKLSTNPNGFILMVEGSQIDWAAHSNDAAGIITEMLAFDKACGVAFDFARKNGETVVVALPDHGNSGFSIGSSKCPNYGTLTKDELFGPLVRMKISRDALVNKIKNTEPEGVKNLFLESTGISLADGEYKQLMQAEDYKKSTFPDAERVKGSKLSQTVAKIIDDHHCFGFTTGGHTGEEVFLAVYDPTPNRLTGHHSNIEINHYLRRSLGLEENAPETVTKEYFAKHTAVFAGYKYTVKSEGNLPLLEVQHKKNKLEIPAYSNTVKWNGKDFKLNSVVVYVDKNNTFYLPQSLAGLLEKQEGK
jgi:alkaline phosphatase